MAGPQRSARGVVVEPGGRLLLQQARDPTAPDAPPFWFLPGGRIEAGESMVEALRRELLEECGLVDLEIGPVLWRQRAAFRFAGLDFDQDELVVLVRVPAAVDVRPTALEAVEALAFRGARWWPPAEVATTSEVVYPLDLAGRLGDAGLLG